MNEWMEDIQMDEDLSNIIMLQDEEGNDIEFAILDVIEYEEKEYVVLMPVEDFDGEVVILEIAEGETEEEDQYVSLESEELLDTLFQIFKEKFKDSFNFTDEEE